MPCSHLCVVATAGQKVEAQHQQGCVYVRDLQAWGNGGGALYQLPLLSCNVILVGKPY